MNIGFLFRSRFIIASIQPPKKHCSVLNSDPGYYKWFFSFFPKVQTYVEIAAASGGGGTKRTRATFFLSNSFFKTFSLSRWRADVWEGERYQRTYLIEKSFSS